MPLFFGQPERSACMETKVKFKNEYRIFRTEVTPAEYILWWVARAAILYAFIKTVQSGQKETLIMQIAAKFAFSFFLPLFCICCREEFFLPDYLTEFRILLLFC